MDQNKEFYVKFPNDFFYNDGNIFNKIGGKNAFLIYSLFTSRKDMLNKIHITVKDIVATLKLDTNISRSKNKIIQSINALIEFGYIYSECSLDNIKVTDTLLFNWVDRFFDKKSGWIPFYASDFEIYSKIGDTAYTLMWLLRMFRNNKTGSSYPSIKTISSTLKISNTTIQNCMQLFRDSGLFKINIGGYYYHKDSDQYKQHNNTYKYSRNVIGVLEMEDSTVEDILKSR